jgi:hypothetical protein
MESNPNNNLEELLNDLKSQHNSSNASEPSPQSNEVENLLANVKSKLKSDRTSVEKNEVIRDNSPVDDYLESLKAQYQDKNHQRQTELKNNRVLAAKKTEMTQDNSPVDDDIDSFKAQYQNRQNKQPNELDDLKSQLKNNQTPTAANNSQTDNYLDSFKAQYQNKQTQQKDREKSNYNQNKQEIIVREQQKQLKRKQLTRQAEQWLAKLDPLSSEGMWFNQLAESYPSRLEAAISYLSTIEQSNL